MIYIGVTFLFSTRTQEKGINNVSVSQRSVCGTMEKPCSGRADRSLGAWLPVGESKFCDVRSPADFFLAPMGRQSIARGGSPWCRVSIKFS